MTSIRTAVAADGPRLVELDRTTWSEENAVQPPWSADTADDVLMARVLQ